MSEQKTEYKWDIERLEEMRVQHEMNPSLLTTKQAYINALEYEFDAATAEANKLIEVLEGEVERKDSLLRTLENVADELKASNNDLREALERILVQTVNSDYDCYAAIDLVEDIAKTTLSNLYKERAQKVIQSLDPKIVQACII